MVDVAKRYYSIDRHVDMAIDITHIAYYGDGDELEMSTGAPSSKSYSWCYKLATIPIVGEEVKFTLGMRPHNANLDELAQRYAGAEAAIKANSNYYHIHDTLSEHLDVTVAHPKDLNQIADTDKKTDRVDAKKLAWMVWLTSVPEGYVPTDEIREVRARATEVGRKPNRVRQQDSRIAVRSRNY